jgi:hypothetical protein
MTMTPAREISKAPIGREPGLTGLLDALEKIAGLEAEYRTFYRDKGKGSDGSGLSPAAAALEAHRQGSERALDMTGLLDILERVVRTEEVYQALFGKPDPDGFEAKVLSVAVPALEAHRPGHP